MDRPPEVADASSLEVVLLTQDRCEQCDRAKDILERVAEEYPLSVSTQRVDSAEGQELAGRGGILFAPGVFIDGEPFSYGRLSERKLRRALDRRLEGHR